SLLSDFVICSLFIILLSAQKIGMLQINSRVIVHLVSIPANNISVVPPDFYTFFSNNQSQYADLLHPNGVGYQSMANIWAQALTGGSTATALSSLTLSPSTVMAGAKSTGTVALNGPAPSGGAAVSLNSSNTGVATVPSS